MTVMPLAVIVAVLAGAYVVYKHDQYTKGTTSGTGTGGSGGNIIGDILTGVGAIFRSSGSSGAYGGGTTGTPIGSGGDAGTLYSGGTEVGTYQGGNVIVGGTSTADGSGGDFSTSDTSYIDPSIGY